MDLPELPPAGSVPTPAEDQLITEMVTYRVCEHDRDRVRAIWRNLHTDRDIEWPAQVSVRLLETSQGVPPNQRILLIVEYPEAARLGASAIGTRIAYALRQRFDAVLDPECSYVEAIRLHAVNVLREHRHAD